MYNLSDQQDRNSIAPLVIGFCSAMSNTACPWSLLRGGRTPEPHYYSAHDLRRFDGGPRKVVVRACYRGVLTPHEIVAVQCPACTHFLLERLERLNAMRSNLYSPNPLTSSNSSSSATHQRLHPLHPLARLLEIVAAVVAVCPRSAS